MDDTEKTQDPGPVAPVTSAPDQAQIDANAATLVHHENWLGALEDKVETLFGKFHDLADTGVLGGPAKAGADLTQEIVNFLHRLFPGHAAPGTASPVPPGPLEHPGPANPVL